MDGFDEAGNALPLNTTAQGQFMQEGYDKFKAEQDAIAASYQGGAANQMENKPTVCRMVLFHTTEHDQKIYSQPAVLPAVVTFVNPDGSVNLTIFSDSHDNSYQKNVMQGPAPGQWDWPQY